MENKNKIAELEKKIETSSELSSIMDVFSLALNEMKQSFWKILSTRNDKNSYFITPDLEKFEKKWLEYLNSDNIANE